MPNTPFLSLVAKDLIARFGTDLAQIALVFPNTRASLFFNNYLYQEAKKTLWAPQYRSIDSLFEQASPLQKGDPIALIGELYQAYIEVYNRNTSVPSDETLDEFFFFGETLLADFDDIDKNLANAQLLFSNLQDLDQLRGDFSYLSENQIKTFTDRFNASLSGDSALKNSFQNIWNILGEVYSVFKSRLKENGLAYPGMLIRSVIENEDAKIEGKQFVFVGFNVLNKCEERLFSKLKDRSLFYWDYDSYYIQSEAGRFIEKNIRKFGSALDKSLFDSFLAIDRKITFLASPSETAQTAIIPEWIESLGKEPSFTQPDSAIVLCNESILHSTMHAIPPDRVENVNITMGFPITQTPISSFLQSLTDLQISGATPAGVFRYRYVLPVLRHPYTKILFPEAGEVEKEITEHNIFYPTKEVLRNELLFSYQANTASLANYLLKIVKELGIAFGKEESKFEPYQGLYDESIFRAFQVLNRLNDLIVHKAWKIEKSTFLRLLQKILSTTKIPFHGEPVKGLQVMGTLETRTLDFKNLLLLSVNEGFMPGSINENSFIPEFIRVHFELSTIEHQDAIYAYYFYRLIQRAEHITFVYNTDKTQMGKAEISRFLLQLLIDPRLKDKIERRTLQASTQPWLASPIHVNKTPEIIGKIKATYDLNTNPEAARLSPTALNTYISCSFKFYQQYIEKIKAPDEMSDEMDNSIVGSIFHRAAEYLYKQIGRIPVKEKKFPAFTVHREDLSPYLKTPHLIEKLVTQAFAEEYFKGKFVEPKDFNGQQLINYKIICLLMKRLLEFDSKKVPFTLVGLEYNITRELDLGKNKTLVKIGGIIDRLEEKDGSYCIVDYKSSGTSKRYNEISDLFEQKDGRASHIFQTFVYASALLYQIEFKAPVVPALIYMQETQKDDYSPVIVYQKRPIIDFRELNDEFESLLKEKVNEIFDVGIPFSQTESVSTCKYCDFKEMCKPYLSD